MFDVREGGDSVPIKWDKGNFQPDKSIIILDEGTLSLFLWHGARQGLVARRTALRQAESLKGHGYTVGKSIVGRDIKALKEIDQRKIGRDPETDKLNSELQEILKREFRELENFMVTFNLTEFDLVKTKPAPAAAKPEPKPAPAAKPEPKPTPAPVVAKSEPKAVPKAVPAPAVAKQEPKPIPSSSPVKTEIKPVSIPAATKKPNFASEYDMNDSIPDIQSEVKAAPSVKHSAPVLAPKAEESSAPSEDLSSEAKIAFVIKSIMDHYDDIWISKKQDGSISIEMMDGPIASFTIKDGKITFSTNSFASINPSIKNDIQQKFVKLSKLL